jgi:integrase
MSVRIRVRVKAPRRLSYYQFHIVDTLTGKSHQRSSKVQRTERNRALAQRKAAELERTLNAAGGGNPIHVTWEQFRGRMETDFYASIAPATRTAYDSVLNRLERDYQLHWLRDITTELVRDYVKRLRSDRLSESTVDKHLRHLFATLRWARAEGLLAVLPDKPPTPRNARGAATKAKGRAISSKELELLIAAIPKVCEGTRVAQIERLLRGWFVTGLRLSEACNARWEADADVYPLFADGFYPVWVFSSAQKSRREEHAPMSPEGAAFLLATPEEERQGFIFELDGRLGRLTETTVSKLISRIGEAAGIQVGPINQRTGKPKYASAHDLRRSFAQGLAYKVRPAVLKLAMRHKSHLTTDKFYVGADAQAASEAMWRASESPRPA